MKGKIIKGIAGFYYVHVPEEGVYECKAKGIFRKEKIKPLVGDNVEIDVVDQSNLKGNIVQILPRSNELIRPAVANIDQAVIIFATASPTPNFNLLDRFLIMMEKQGVDTVICFNKKELVEKKELEILEENYKECSKDIIFVSALQERGIEELKEILEGKTSAVAGPSGVGKSSLINLLQDNSSMEIGAISEKIQRGKHTTRHSELIHVSGETYIMDTPGFSSISILDFEKDELKNYFPEFVKYEEKCRFQGCSHLKEPGCGVKEALEEGKISQIRYDNYKVLYSELKDKRRY